MDRARRRHWKVRNVTQGTELTDADRRWLLLAFRAGAGCWYATPTGMRRRARLQALGLVNDMGSVSPDGIAVVQHLLRVCV
jgi:hypothetical protein